MAIPGLVLKIMGFMNAGLFCLFPFYLAYFIVRSRKAGRLAPEAAPLIDVPLVYALFAFGFLSPSVLPLNPEIGLRGLFADFSGFLLIVTMTAPPQLLAAIYLDDKRFKQAMPVQILPAREKG